MSATGFTLILASALSFFGCSGGRHSASYSWQGRDTATMADVRVVPGPMPTGETFAGAYHSQEIGDVNIEQSGDSAVGSYEYDRANCHVLGRLDGRVEGNLWHFTWTEDHRQCGRMGSPSGHGYFLFWKDSADNGRLAGEWGFADEEAGNGRWFGFRSLNVRPQVRRGGSGSESSRSEGSSGTGNTQTPASPRPGTSGTSGAPSSTDPLQGL